MRTLSLLTLLLFGCPGGEDDTAKNTEGDADTDTDADSDADADTDPSVAPFVVSVDRVECTKQQSAGEVWDSQITVDDPQGNDTVGGGTFYVLNNGGGELANGALACGGGQCFGTWRADLTGIGCDQEGDIIVRFVVTDDDGNNSAPSDYQTM